MVRAFCFHHPRTRLAFIIYLLEIAPSRCLPLIAGAAELLNLFSHNHHKPSGLEVVKDDVCFSA